MEKILLYLNICTPWLVQDFSINCIIIFLSDLFLSPVWIHPLKYWGSPTAGEEIYWYAGLGRKITSDAVTGETIAISGHEKNPNSELVAAITGETGPLHAGALPACGGSTEEADKNAWDSIMKTTTVKGKTPKNPKKAEGDEPEEVVPKTWKEILIWFRWSSEVLTRVSR